VRTLGGKSYDAIGAAGKQADMKEIVQSLRDHNRFIREYLITQFYKLLP
jgi:hypothetical protein